MLIKSDQNVIVISGSSLAEPTLTIHPIFSSAAVGSINTGSG